MAYLVKSGMLPVMLVSLQIEYIYVLLQLTCKCRPRTSYGGHARQPKPCLGTSSDCALQFKDCSPSTSLVNTPTHHGNRSDGRSNKLGHKKVSKFGGRDKQEWQLNDPEEEVRDHSLRSNSSITSHMVWDFCVGGPNSRQHDCYTDGSIGALDSQPEHGQDRARYNAEIGQVVSKARSNDD